MKYSKLSDWTIKKILRCFCNELTAVQTAKQLHLNRNTIDRYYDIFRRRIAAYQEIQKQKFRGSIEIDESYFGSRHRGDPRGRSAAAKIPVVGILKRHGIVYTEIIPDASRRSLMPVIAGLIEKSRSNIYTDKWKSYDGLALSGHKHHRINHSKEFVKNHILSVSQRIRISLQSSRQRPVRHHTKNYPQVVNLLGKTLIWLLLILWKLQYRSFS